MCYLWGCGLSVSRTPGAVQAPSSGGGGRRAGGPAGLRCASPPRPAPLAGAAGHPLPRWAGDGVARRGSARRAARPPPGPARPRPARPGPPGQPLPAVLGGAPLPKGPPRRAGRGGREGEDRGGEGRGRRCGWLAVRPGIRPAAGSGPGLTCSLSSAIESVHPGFRSVSLQNMQNMRQICSICIEICRICNKICTIICRICNEICKIICRIVTSFNSAY